MIKNFLLFIFLFTVSQSILPQTEDADAYKDISQIGDAEERIEAIKSFRENYPESNLNTRSLNDLFRLYSSIKNEDSALAYADKYLSAIPENNRTGAYNSVAYQLALNEIGLNKAEEYISEAVAAARETKSRALSAYLDTQALVLYHLGNIDSALTLQREAIAGHEEDPEYLLNLAVYEHAAGNEEAGIITSAKAVFYGDNNKALNKFNEWSARLSSDKKENIVNYIVNEKIESAENKIEVKSAAAGFLATININLNKAEAWAKEAVNSIDKSTSINNTLAYRKNYALVLAANGENKEALVQLKMVDEFATPWDTDFWYTMGKVNEELGNYKKADEAYLNGLLAFDNDKLKNAAADLYNNQGWDQAVVKDKIKKMKEDAENFEAGHYTPSESYQNKTVLAELFTGAECPPCVAADFAFDKLSEYYPKNNLAILEYHLHIPGPDPMTNPDTWERYEDYGASFGTPTVFIDGQEKIIGGGPSYLTANRFNVYKYAIGKNIDEEPGVFISGSAKRDGKIINVDVKVEKQTKDNPDVSLRLALVENQVDYTGSNGVSKHIYVVRDLDESIAEKRLEFINGKEEASVVFDLNEIEKGLSDYLDDPAKFPGWRFKEVSWRARTDKIDDNNLSVVAWIQNNENKKVLQSYFIDLRK